MKKVFLVIVFLALAGFGFSQTWTEFNQSLGTYEYTVVTKEKWYSLVRQREKLDTYAIVDFGSVEQANGDGWFPVIHGKRPVFNGDFYLLAILTPSDDMPEESRNMMSLAGMRTAFIYGNTGTGKMMLVFLNNYGSIFPGAISVNSVAYTSKFNACRDMVEGANNVNGQMQNQPPPQTRQTQYYNTNTKPAIQTAFENVVVQSYQQYKNAATDLQRGKARLDRKFALEKLNLLEANNWIGTISSLTASSSGETASVYIRINDITRLEDVGRISYTSPLYAKLLNMESGQKVKFSGKFFLSNNDEDYFHEYSWTQYGSMTDPEFVFEVTEITAID